MENSAEDPVGGGRVTRSRRKRLESCDSEGPSSRSSTPLPTLKMDSIPENSSSKRITRRNSNTHTPSKTPLKAKEIEQQSLQGTPTRNTRRRLTPSLIQEDVVVGAEMTLKQKQLNPLPEEEIKSQKEPINIKLEKSETEKGENPKIILREAVVKLTDICRKPTIFIDLNDTDNQTTKHESEMSDDQQDSKNHSKESENQKTSPESTEFEKENEKENKFVIETEQTKTSHLKSISFNNEERQESVKKIYPKTPASKKSPSLPVKKDSHSKRKITIDLEESVIFIDEDENDTNNLSIISNVGQSKENASSIMINNKQINVNNNDLEITPSKKNLRSNHKNVQSPVVSPKNTIPIETAKIELPDSTEENTFESAEKKTTTDAKSPLTKTESSSSPSSNIIENAIETSEKEQISVESLEADTTIKMSNLIVSDSNNDISNKDEETLKTNVTEITEISISEDLISTKSLKQLPLEAANNTSDITDLKDKTEMKVMEGIESSEISTAKKSDEKNSLKASNMPIDREPSNSDDFEAIIETSLVKKTKATISSSVLEHIATSSDEKNIKEDKTNEAIESESVPTIVPCFTTSESVEVLSKDENKITDVSQMEFEETKEQTGHSVLKNVETLNNSNILEFNPESPIKKDPTHEIIEENLPSETLLKPMDDKNLLTGDATPNTEKENSITNDGSLMDVSAINLLSKEKQISEPVPLPLEENSLSNLTIESNLSKMTLKTAESTLTANGNSSNISTKIELDEFSNSKEFEVKENLYTSDAMETSITEFNEEEKDFSLNVSKSTIKENQHSEILSNDSPKSNKINSLGKMENESDKKCSNANETEEMNEIFKTIKETADENDSNTNNISIGDESMNVSSQSAAKTAIISQSKKATPIKILSVINIDANSKLIGVESKSSTTSSQEIQTSTKKEEKIVEAQALNDPNMDVSPFPKSWTQSIKQQSDKIDSINIISSSKIDENEKKDDEKIEKEKKMEIKKTLHFAETMESSPEYQMNVDTEEDDEEFEEKSEKSIFMNNEAECAGPDYESGDSMSSTERKDYEENQIESDVGESIGSDDTDCYEDASAEEDENDSFIASDNEEDEELLDYSDDNEHLAAESEIKKSKKYKRLVKIESDSDETDAEDENNEQYQNFSENHSDKENDKEAKKGDEQPTSTDSEIANAINVSMTSMKDEKSRLSKSLRASVNDSVVIHESSNNQNHKQLTPNEGPTTTARLSIDETMHSPEKTKKPRSKNLNSSKDAQIHEINKSLNKSHIETPDEPEHEEPTSSVMLEINANESLKSSDVKSKRRSKNFNSSTITNNSDLAVDEILNVSQQQQLKSLSPDTKCSLDDSKNSKHDSLNKTSDNFSEVKHETIDSENMNSSLKSTKSKRRSKSLNIIDQQDLSTEHELDNASKESTSENEQYNQTNSENQQKELLVESNSSETENENDDDENQEDQDKSINSSDHNESTTSLNKSSLTLESGSDVENELRELIEATSEHQLDIKSNRRQTLQTTTTKTDNNGTFDQKPKRQSLLKLNNKEKELSQSFVECLNEQSRQKQLAAISGKRKLSQSFSSVPTPELQKTIKKPKHNITPQALNLTPSTSQKNKASYQNKLSPKKGNSSIKKKSTNVAELNSAEKLQRIAAIKHALQASRNILSPKTSKTSRKNAMDENSRKRRRDETIEQPTKIFKTNAGLVIETEVEPPKPKKLKQILEVIETATGNFLVEPSSPIPNKKRNRWGFQETPATPINPGWKMQGKAENENIVAKGKHGRWIQHPTGLIKVEEIVTGVKNIRSSSRRTQKLASESAERARNLYQSAMNRPNILREDTQSMLRRKKFI